MGGATAALRYPQSKHDVVVVLVPANEVAVAFAWADRKTPEIMCIRCFGDSNLKATHAQRSRQELAHETFPYWVIVNEANIGLVTTDQERLEVRMRE